MDAAYLKKQINHLKDRIGGLELRVTSYKDMIGTDDPLEILESRLEDLRKGLSAFENELASLSE